MPPDPFTTLGPDQPVAPRPEFAAALRRRLVDALAAPPSARPAVPPTRSGRTPPVVRRGRAAELVDRITQPTTDRPTPTRAVPARRPADPTVPPTRSDPMPTQTTTTTVLTPYLSVRDAAAAIDFYRRAFDATETFRFDDADGRIGHAELQIGGATLHLADEYPEAGHVGPITLGGSPVLLSLVVPDVDAVVARAVAEGATLVREVADQFYGDRVGQIVDPFGHRWSISTRVEDVSLEEMQRRAREEQA
jgi:PhnB protein